MGRIWTDIKRLAKELKKYSSVVLTSGGFDPIHIGHIRCLLHSQSFGHLVVIVNGDEFLKNKKDFVFMPLAERLEIVAAIEGVQDVIGWYDGTQYVDRAIKLLKPHIFTKGGDRSSLENIAECEIQTCNKIGCRIECGVGGGKIQSSSWLVDRWKNGSCKE